MLHSFSSSKNSSERMERSGFLIPAASKISMTFSETKALSITYANQGLKNE